MAQWRSLLSVRTGFEIESELDAGGFSQNET